MGEGKPEGGGADSQPLLRRSWDGEAGPRPLGVLPVVSGNLCLLTQSCLTLCNIP